MAEVLCPWTVLNAKVLWRVKLRKLPTLLGHLTHVSIGCGMWGAWVGFCQVVVTPGVDALLHVYMMSVRHPSWLFVVRGSRIADEVAIDGIAYIVLCGVAVLLCVVVRVQAFK